jgi:putative RecB family exonuclease
LSSARFSYSRIQIFQQCPAKYRFIYLEELDAAGESIESYLGSRLHEVLEWLYRERRTGRNILFDDLLAQYRTIWRETWHDNIGIIEPEWQVDHYYSLGQRCLAGYYRQYAPFDEPVENVEMSINFQLDDSGDYEMTGVLDRLDSHGAGWWSIHDYKSGKSLLTNTKASSDLQMRIYYLGLLRILTDVQRVDVKWHFLRYGKEIGIDSVTWQPSRITTMLKKRIDQIREAEQQTEQLEPNESMLCNWCYYWQVCPAKTDQRHPALRSP